MSDELPAPTPEHQELELHEYQELEPLLVGYDWLRVACDVISALSLMLIAIALLVRL